MSKLYWCGTHRTYHGEGTSCSDVNPLCGIEAEALHECEIAMRQLNDSVRIAPQRSYCGKSIPQQIAQTAGELTAKYRGLTVTDDICEHDSLSISDITKAMCK